MADDENNNHDHWPFRAGIGLFVLIVGFYSINIEGSLSSDTTDWGTFGDYVGGIANPVIALIVLYYVYRTFLSQRQQLKEAREEFRKSREEQEKQTKIQKIETKILIKQQVANFIKPLVEKWENKVEELNKEHEVKIDGDLSLLDVQDQLREKMEIGDLTKEIKNANVNADRYRNEYTEITNEIASYEKKLDEI